MEDKENAFHLGIVAYILNDLEIAVLDDKQIKLQFISQTNMIKTLVKNCIDMLLEHGHNIEDAKITIESKNYVKTIQVKADDFLVQPTEG